MRIDLNKDISTSWMLAISFIAALLMISVQILSKQPRTPHDDEIRYINAANGLITNSAYNGRANPPAYPALIAVVSYFDTDLRKSVRCFSKNDTGAGCPNHFSTLIAIQAIMAAMTGVFIFYLAFAISNSWLVAWLTMIIALATGEFAYFSRTVLSENTAFFGVYGFSLFLVLADAQKRMTFVLIAGLFLGLAILSRSAYLYMAHFSIILLVIIYYIIDRDNLVDHLKRAVLLAIGIALIVLPWSLRNYYWFGDFALTDRFAAFVLLQRVVYNIMTWQEWGASFIFWLPDFGDNLAKYLFSPSSYQRLDFSSPNGFYLISTAGEFGQQMAKNAGSSDQLFGYLLRERVLGDPINHILVSIPLTLRGLWVANYLSLAGVLLLYPAVKQLYLKGQLMLFSLFSAPLMFMVVFHGAISINIVRYNTPMIAVFSFILATLAATLIKVLLPQSAGFYQRNS